MKHQYHGQQRRSRCVATSLCLVFTAVFPFLAACSGSSGSQTNPTGSGRGGTSTATQNVGEHAIVFTRLDDNQAVLATPELSTFGSGSTLVVGVGRGDILYFESPTDNKGNGDFPRVGETHSYTNWPDSGTAVYAVVDAAGGDGHIISTNKPPADEVTMAVVEVYGGQIEDFAWNEVLVGSPLTSGTVNTSGPATLVAFWWGDAGVYGEKNAVPDGGFQVIESVLEAGPLVQCAVAVAHVDSAGTYDVTWTATPDQGAQMWLVAVSD